MSDTQETEGLTIVGPDGATLRRDPSGAIGHDVIKLDHGIVVEWFVFAIDPETMRHPIVIKTSHNGHCVEASCDSDPITFARMKGKDFVEFVLRIANEATKRAGEVQAAMGMKSAIGQIGNT